MSKPWYEGGTQARVYRTLLAQPTKSLDYDALRELLPDLSNNIVSQTLNRLKVQGYVRRGLALQGAKPAWALVPGRAQPPVVDSAGQPVALAAAEAAQGQDASMPRGLLALTSARMLAAHDAGYDSQALAQHTNTTVQAVDEALLPALLDNRLSSCRLMRHGITLMHYRLSGSTAGYDWAERCEHAWQTKPEQLSAALAAREPIQAPAPVAAAPKAPAPAPRAPSLAENAAPAQQQKRGQLAASAVVSPENLASMRDLSKIAAAYIEPFKAAHQTTAAPAVDTASEVVPPAATPAPAPKVGVVGELDIDAMHRQVAFAEGDEAQFLAALYSNGKLTITSHGQRLTLPLDHTRQLLHYLDHLRCSDMVADMLGGLS